MLLRNFGGEKKRSDKDSFHILGSGVGLKDLFNGH